MIFASVQGQGRCPPGFVGMLESVDSDDLLLCPHEGGGVHLQGDIEINGPIHVDGQTLLPGVIESLEDRLSKIEQTQLIQLRTLGGQSPPDSPPILSAEQRLPLAVTGDADRGVCMVLRGGLPVIGRQVGTAFFLQFCQDTVCSTVKSISVSSSATAGPGRDCDLSLLSDGRIRVAFRPFDSLQLATCSLTSCDTISGPGDTGQYVRMITENDISLVLHRGGTNGTLFLTHCSEINCTGTSTRALSNTPSASDTADMVLFDEGIVIMFRKQGSSSGFGVVCDFPCLEPPEPQPVNTISNPVARLVVAGDELFSVTSGHFEKCTIDGNRPVCRGRTQFGSSLDHLYPLPGASVLTIIADIDGTVVKLTCPSSCNTRVLASNSFGYDVTGVINGFFESYFIYAQGVEDERVDVIRMCFDLDCS